LSTGKIIAKIIRLVLLSAAAAALVAIIVAAAAVPRASAAGTSREEVAEALTCQCGCGLTVANCNHPNCSFSVPTREKIDAMLARGMGGAQVIAYFRKQYGEKILSAPTRQGFNLLAWTMPFVALLFGGGIVILMMGRWRSGAADSSADADAAKARHAGNSAGFDSALRERLERELRERI
jgi:cytochrome c-type biogenesis protein CcmH